MAAGFLSGARETSKSDSHLHDKGNELPENQWHWHRLNQHQTWGGASPLPSSDRRFFHQRRL